MHSSSVDLIISVCYLTGCNTVLWRVSCLKWQMLHMSDSFTFGIGNSSTIDAAVFLPYDHVMCGDHNSSQKVMEWTYCPGLIVLNVL